jgi:hypothetical protein
MDTFGSMLYYVMFSRVAGLSNIAFTRDFPREELLRKPSVALTTELSRLDLLSQDTVAWWNLQPPNDQTLRTTAIVPAVRDIETTHTPQKPPGSDHPPEKKRKKKVQIYQLEQR